MSRNDNKTDDLDPSKITGGFDIYKNITPNLVGAVTINTDFAETEVDARKLNLTRFPLYYPEKRTFFLEGSDIFDFGSTSSSTFLPFFSRRIGLIEGKQVPLKWGTKLFGKINNTNLALLDVQSGPMELTSPTNMFAAEYLKTFLMNQKLVSYSRMEVSQENRIHLQELISSIKHRDLWVVTIFLLTSGV